MTVRQAVVLVAHGTVDSLEDLADFATRIRRGHAAPPELVAELRRRYEVIGGSSPLNGINRRVAQKLEGALGVPVRLANRFAAPFVKDVLAGLAAEGVTRVASVPLAQYSGHVYEAAVREAAAGLPLETVSAPSWGSEPLLVEAFAATIGDALGAAREGTTLALTAHSLPVAAIHAGDPYETDVRAAAEAVVARLGERAPRHVVAFQSQGMSAGPGGRPVQWLGPDLLAMIDECRARGDARIVFAPIGFLADHVEILHDLDVEARRWVEERGMAYHRARSLDDSDALVRALARVAEPLVRRA